MPSIVPRPSMPPVFDRLQHAKRSKTGGVKGLGTRLERASSELTFLCAIESEANLSFFKPHPQMNPQIHHNVYS